MYLQNNFYVIMFFMTIYNLTYARSSNIQLVVAKKGLDVVTPCSIGLVFYVEVDNTSGDDMDVELSPDRCCIGEDINCKVLEVIGACVERIPKGTSKTLRAVAPLLDPFERTGNCIFFLDSKPTTGNMGVMRDEIKLNFDTRLSNKDQPMLVPNNLKSCDKADEDPLNNCSPVDCDTYYNAKKSYFDKKFNKCAEVPSCVTKRNTDLPSVYDPINNKCIVEQFVTNDDLVFIKELAEHGEKTKDVITMNNQSLNEHKFMNNTAHVIRKKNNKTQNKYVKYIISKYITTNKCTLTVLGIVILVQCCLICTMIYFLSRNCSCCNEKKVVGKFFNYRQDASVTTPLIGTSNIDTETTEFNYSSEFTNHNKKIKCYKACQKERKNNMKVSMSDEILSKCITRRDWSCKPVRSDAITEVINAETMKQANYDKSNEYETESNNKLESFETKLNLMNEVPSKINENVKKLTKITTDEAINIEYRDKDRNGKTESKGTQYDLSEKEIKCHNYDCMGVNSDGAGFFPSTHSKTLGFYTTDQRKKLSLSNEKSVQAAISNDSLDDYLFERRMNYLPSENISQYSRSNASNIIQKTQSSLSNKTSKNLVKNMLSLLHIRSNHSPSSDPGISNSKPADVELIHMSHASIESSSIGESDYLKVPKKAKD